MRPLKALVTGAARGLGEAVAERIVRDGGEVVLVDVAPAVADTASRLGAAALVGDVSDEAFVERAVAEAVSRLDGLQLVVNNAGIGGGSAHVVDTPLAEFRRVLDVNLVGPFLVARAAARAMLARRSAGAIVNVGSIFGQEGVAGGAAYCASKGAVAVLTHSLALELAPHGIRVNTIAPGNMATEMHWEHLRGEAERSGTSFEDERRRILASIPLGRHGTGSDVAGAVAWLASEDASYVTGQTIGVNGGVLLT